MEQLAIPTPKKPIEKHPTAEQQLFVGTFIALSWQLLVLVLLPAIGGHYIDQKTGRSPLFTILGFVLAIILAALATYRAYKTVSDGSKHV